MVVARGRTRTTVSRLLGLAKHEERRRMPAYLVFCGLVLKGLLLNPGNFKYTRVK
jgi:hypothetical protein